MPISLPSLHLMADAPFSPHLALPFCSPSYLSSFPSSIPYPFLSCCIFRASHHHRISTSIIASPVCPSSSCICSLPSFRFYDSTTLPLRVQLHRRRSSQPDCPEYQCDVNCPPSHPPPRTPSVALSHLGCVPRRLRKHGSPNERPPPQPSGLLASRPRPRLSLSLRRKDRRCRQGTQTRSP